jgi:predicted nucleic acid-binding protein
MYVLDASVVLKWFLEEEDSAIAIKLRQKYMAGTFNLALPDLILYEVANALRYDKKFLRGAASEAILSLIDLGVDIIVPTASLIERALQIAHENKTTVYDAVYVSLAQEMGYYLITADHKLYDKVRNMGIVKLLRDSY